MIKTHHHRLIFVLSNLVVLLNGSPSASADDKTAIAEAKRAAFQKSLTHVIPAFAEGPTTEWKRIYHSALNDSEKWKRIVRAEEDEDTRTSRAGEVLAFSGQYKVEPVKIGGFDFPVKSKGGGYTIFAYRAVKRLEKGRWVDVPDAIRKRRYLLVRGLVPRKNDPYDIVTCTYLGGLSEQDIVRLVNQSRNF